MPDTVQSGAIDDERAIVQAIRARSTEDKPVPDDNMERITKQGREVIDKVSNAVEKTGKQVAKSVSHLTGGRLEDVTEDVIQESVDKALDMLEVAGDQVRERGMDAERISIQVGVSVASVAHLTLTSNVPAEQTGQGAGLAMAQSDPEEL